VADRATTLTLTASVVQEEEWHVARCVEVDVASQGRSVDEALVNLKEALELYFEGEPGPHLATKPIVAPVEVRISASP
jgi:predicted RNase H-like HicB family nuclease